MSTSPSNTSAGLRATGSGSSAVDVRRAPNGMTVVCEPMAGVRSAAITVLVPAGSVHDPEHMLGTASVMSELLMRDAGGSTSRDMAEAFERLGASRGCDAGARFMHLSASMTGDRLERVVGLLAPMVLTPACTADGVEAARELALQSLASLADDPQQRAAYAARARHYAPPYHHSGLGTAEGLGAITPERVRDWWDAHATPGGAIIGIAGAVDSDEANDVLARAFESWSGSAGPIKCGAEPPRGYAHESDDSNQVQIIVMHDGPIATDPSCMTQRVATAVLSGGMSGRLFTEVREKRGLCYAVSASYRPEPEFGTLSAYVGTTPERAQEALDVLVGELSRLHEGNVTREEFDRAVVGLKSRLVFAGESTAARAASVALDTHRLGAPRTMDDVAAEIDAVTLDGLNDFLRAGSLGATTIQTLGPKALKPPV